MRGVKAKLVLVLATVFLAAAWGGSSAYTVSVPPTPQNLTATATGPSSVALSWDMNGSADGFMFYRNDSSGGCSFSVTAGDLVSVYGGTASTGGSVTHYELVDTGLDSCAAPQASEIYRYSMTAYNENPASPGLLQYSLPSGEVMVKTPGTVKAPTGLAAAIEAGDSVKLTWTDNSNDEAGFKIERKDPGGTWTEIGNGPMDWPQYIDPGRTLGETYSYRVRAYNFSGDSLYSNEVSITVASAGGGTGSGSLLTAPTGLTATATSPSTIDLSWTDNATGEDYYTILRSTDTSAPTELQAAADATSYTDSGLQPGTTYTYTVRAQSFTAGAGPESAPASATTPGTGGSGAGAPDVSAASSWAQAEIIEAWNLGLTTPKVLTGFQEPITREEFCELAVLLYEKLTGASAVPVSPNPFTDTSNPEILKAFNLGVTNGITATEFGPDLRITREQICTMIVRTLCAADPLLDPTAMGMTAPTDWERISGWARDGVYYCYNMNIMQGVGGGRVDPQGTTTREQAVLLIKRTYEKMTPI